MQFLALIAVIFMALAHNASAAAKTKSPTSNCPVPPKGCSSQATLYSCTNPLYFGCEWSCGNNNKLCGAAYNDVRFPEYGTPNRNFKCNKNKVCCKPKKDCLMTGAPTSEPTQQPTLEPTNAPTTPTVPSKAPTPAPTVVTKKPTPAPTVRCMPQPKLGCTGIKPHTKLQCLGANFEEFLPCCTWTQNVDPKDPSVEIPGGVCTLRTDL